MNNNAINEKGYETEKLEIQSGGVFKQMRSSVLLFCRFTMLEII